jgi:pimeloyl-ACP methyl ester carboxylesterase
MAEANGPKIYEQQQEAIIARPDSRPTLPKIKVPTLIVVGEGDQITPPDAAREMHEGIGGSKLAVIPRAGHLALLEQPEPVHTALREWAAA